MKKYSPSILLMIHTSPVMSIKLTSEQIANLTAIEAAEMIKSGSLSSERLVKEFIRRARKFKNLNAFITLDEQNALSQAKEADMKVKNKGKLGKLHGVPLVVKDNIDVKGMPTTAGTPALLNHYPQYNAPVIDELIKEGAIILGKTNMHELAFGITSKNGYFGPVRNPYNPELFPGGSSGGTAAAISARLAPAGLGTDTGGSVRIPSALTGIYGFRPSKDRYSRKGIVPISKTKDTAGPMARSIMDLILLDSIIVGESPQYQPKDLKKIRLGIPRYSFYSNLDRETEKIVQEALDELTQNGVELIEANIPDVDTMDRAVDFPIALYEVRRALPEYLKSCNVSLCEVIEKISSPDVKYLFNTFITGKDAISEKAHQDAIRIYRPAMEKAYSDYFKKHMVDGIIFPTTPAPARPIKTSDETVDINGKQVPTFTTYLKNTSPGSDVGIPGLTLPIGLTSEGLPVGIEIDGPIHSDKEILQIGLALENVFGHIRAPEKLTIEKSMVMSFLSHALLRRSDAKKDISILP